MSSDNPKQALYAQFAAIAKAMAHEHRRTLLELVAQGECSVESLAEHSGLTVANASQHLKHLRRAGLVTARRHGKFVLYCLADEAVLTMLAAMHTRWSSACRQVERILNSYFRARDELEPVSRAKLLRRAKRGLVTVLDVRPKDEFVLGHLAGACNIPLAQLKRQLATLETQHRDRHLLPGVRTAFSPSKRWPGCASSALRRGGWRTVCRSGGAAGMPIETGQGSQ